MSKRIDSLMIQIELSKNESNEVDVDVTAHLGFTATEYGASWRKGISVALSETQRGAVIKFAKDILDDIRIKEEAEEALPRKEKV